MNVGHLAVITRQRSVSNQYRMIRIHQAYSGRHTHASVISVIMCQIKRYKASMRTTSNRIAAVIIRAFGARAAVCTATNWANVMMLNHRNLLPWKRWFAF